MADWLAYAEIEPFGDFRADVRAGIVASTIANVHRGKGQRAFGAADFMPFHKKQQPALAVEVRTFLKGLKTTRSAPDAKSRKT